MVTALVLLAAVTIDALARRGRVAPPERRSPEACGVGVSPEQRQEAAGALQAAKPLVLAGTAGWS